MKAYILIGGNGFIGKYMYNYINNLPDLDENDKIIIIDPTLTTESTQPNTIYINKNFEESVDILYNYIQSNLDLNSTIEIHHLAANVGVQSVIDNENYFKEEILLNNSLILFLNKISTYKINFIYYSTSEVYGDLEYQYENKPLQIPSIEDPKFKRNRYGVLKNFEEYYFNDICDQLNINLLIIRPYNVIGIGQRDEFIIPKMISDAFLNNKITIYGSGDQRRVFIDVNEFIEAVFRSIDQILIKKNFDFKILNIANLSNYTSIKNIADIISRKVSYQTKEEITIDYVDDEIMVGQIKRIPDVERLYRKINYRPQKKLSLIIDEYLTWYINKTD